MNDSLGLGSARGSAFSATELRLSLHRALPLAMFLSLHEPLPLSACQKIVTEAIKLIEGAYAHLPVKRAMYAIDPARRLRLLRMRLDRMVAVDLKQRCSVADDLWFHKEMSATLASARDMHTVYMLPAPFANAVAFVPVQIEWFWADGVRRFAVTNVVDGLKGDDLADDLDPGAEVTHWNGVPIPRAVELAGEQSGGGNQDARLARGVARLTMRPLAKSLPPDEEWATIRYQPRNGGPYREQTLTWRVLTLPEGEPPPPDGAELREANGEGLDHEIDIIREVRRAVYAPAAPKEGLRRRKRAEPPAKPLLEEVEDLPELPPYFEARKFRLPASESGFGYIRIRSFKVANHARFLRDFIRLLQRLPETGLIIDVRDNPGGYIKAGERLLQTLTPRTIEPEPLYFINSPLNLQICETVPELMDWAPSIRRAEETSSQFSAGFPLTPPEQCNNKGQKYHGPVVLITNALSYSTTDIFAAGFQDHEIGVVLGIDGSTGAGGANVMTHSGLSKRAALAREAAQRWGNPPPNWPLQELPGGVDLRLAIRRTMRVGRHAGMELEDIGVVADALYPISKADLLNQNQGLIRAAAEILAKKPWYRLRPRKIARHDDGSIFVSDDGTISLSIATRGINRLDIRVDGWSVGSWPVADGTNPLTVPLPLLQPGLMHLEGYRLENGVRKLVAARKLSLQPRTQVASEATPPETEPEA